MRNQNDRFNEKLSQIRGPTFDLAPLETAEKMFSGRSRLYIGNIAQEVEENDLKELFAPYGETSEYFISKEKSFGFLRVVCI